MPRGWSPDLKGSEQTCADGIENHRWAQFAEDGRFECPRALCECPSSSEAWFRRLFPHTLQLHAGPQVVENLFPRENAFHLASRKNRKLIKVVLSHDFEGLQQRCFGTDRACLLQWTHDRIQSDHRPLCSVNVLNLMRSDETYDLTISDNEETSPAGTKKHFIHKLLDGQVLIGAGKILSRQVADLDAVEGTLQRRLDIAFPRGLQ